MTFWTQDKNYLASTYNLTQNVKEGEPYPKLSYWKENSERPVGSSQPPKEASFQDAVQTLHKINTNQETHVNKMLFNLFP